MDWGELRRLTPIDDAFGLGRGRPIDRHYIEGFLARHADDVRGRVLEVGESTYTRRFGGNRVTRADVLHMDRDHPGATVVADLTDAPHVADASFDCFVCTQTLTYVHDLPAAVRTAHRMLAVAGTFLVTVPGISQTSPYDRMRWGEHWRFTTDSLERLLGDAFGPGNVQVESHGNVLAAIAFLHGLACEDVSASELDHRDERYPLVVCARAVRR